MRAYRWSGNETKIYNWKRMRRDGDKDGREIVERGWGESKRRRERKKREGCREGEVLSGGLIDSGNVNPRRTLLPCCQATMNPSTSDHEELSWQGHGGFRLMHSALAGRMGMSLKG